LSASVSNNYRKAFFEVFILGIVTISLPSKVIGYLAPFLCIAWFIIRANSGATLVRLLLYLFCYFIVVCLYIGFYQFVKEEFVIQNSILILLTYSSFIFFLILPANLNFREEDFLKYIKVIRIVIVVQSLLGVFQIFIYLVLNGGNFDSATGDIVQGTLNPLSFLNPLGNFNNQIYTTNLLLLLLFYTPYAVYKKNGLGVCLLGFTALVLASIWHLFIAFLLAIILVSIYFGLLLKGLSISRVLIVFLLTIVISLTIFTQPKNFSLISHYFEKLTSGESPKATVALNSVIELPKDFPWVILIGLGPGQYSSRAGLIGTGKYFGDFNDPQKLPLLEERSSLAFAKYVYPYWEEVATNVPKYGNSTMARPFFSILSIITEFGWILFLILFAVIIFFIKGIKRIFQKRTTESNSLKASYAYACAILVLFFVIFSFFENYLEVPQAIFLGFLMFKYFFEYSKNESAISERT